MVLFAFLPYFCLLGMIAIACNENACRGRAIFPGIIDAAIIWSLLIWLETNLLSFLGLITPRVITGFWILCSLGMVCLLIKYKPRLKIRGPKGWLEGTVTLLCAVTLFIGLVYPPNNWDVASYHMPRVMQWLQNNSLAPFHANIPRQIGMPPFNSMIALQSVAAGSDNLVNLTQWLAFLGSLSAIYAITRRIGGSGKSAALGVLFFATLPSALMQASNTESANLVTFWLLAFAWITLAWVKKPSAAVSLKMGLCLGFAILSKGSSYPLALPFVILVAWLCLKNFRIRFRQGCLMALIVILINLPHLARTYEAYGAIVGGAQANIVAAPSLGTFLTNALYDFLAHEPWLIKITGHENWSAFTRTIFGADENNKDIFPWGGIENAESKFSFQEGTGQNPWHALFIAILLGATALRKFRPPLVYAACAGGAFVFYWLLLTWHPWTGRVQTPLFGLAAPLCGLFLAECRLKWRLALIAPLFISLILPLGMWERPLFPFMREKSHFIFSSRDQLYISYKNHNVPQDYVAAANFLAAQNPRSVGLDIVDDGLEYPLWAILRKKTQKMPRLTNIRIADGVKDDSPDFAWVQRDREGGGVLAPIVMKKADHGYARVFPPQ